MANPQKLGNFVNALFQDASNNIGIGGSPSGSYKLEVTGTAKVSSTLLVSGALTTGSTLFINGDDNSLYQRATTANAALYWDLRTSANTRRAYIGYAGASNPDFYFNNNESGAMIFSTNNTERMRIISTGLVGIGSGASSNPAAYGFFAVSSVITVNTLAGVAGAFSDGVNGTTRLYIQSGVNGINVDQAFVISTGGGVPTERLRITSTGNVGINNTAPSEKLSVTGSISFSNYLLVGTAGYIGVGNQIQGGWTSTDLLILNNNNGGKIAINTTNGSAYNGLFLVSGATSWSPITSDVRTKKNFETTQGLAEVLQIEPTKYHLITDDDNSVKRLGFKAQNLQSLIPEMVISTGNKADDGSDYLTIVPDYLLPVLVKAIQELNQQNQDLKSRLDKAGL
jgi:hypothetical protein